MFMSFALVQHMCINSQLQRCYVMNAVAHLIETLSYRSTVSSLAAAVLLPLVLATA
jgi:hypothetical protein